ncbi:MAG: HAD family hydrolase [Planctomycetia bacterium]|nr:HAD family hydrolase [Planctomycetia bacterium]
MKICLFDIDGTLISSGGAGRAAFYAALEAEFDRPAPHREIAFSGRTDRAILSDLFARHDVEHSEENIRRFFPTYLKVLPQMLSSRGGVVLPGVESLVADLAGRPDVELGLLTGNIQAGAKAKLGHYGLFDYFRFGGFGDQHFSRDLVAADALAAARAALGRDVDPRQVWVIGDTPLDVSCARSIGAHAVAVATGIHTLAELAATGPDLLLADLGDAEPLLQALNG